MPAALKARRLQCSEVWGSNSVVDQPLAMAGMKAHVIARPYRAGKAGGDIHYVSSCAAGMISRFFLADVSGHDEAAARSAQKLRAIMQDNVNEIDQSRFTRTLNKEFGELADGGVFATAVLATYFAPTNHFILCNAGHPPPLWYRAETKGWTLLSPDSPGVLSSGSTPVFGATDLPLGVIEPTEYRQIVAPLSRGDMVVCYTDGLIEAAPLGGTELGTAGLLSLASRVGPADPRALGHGLLEAVAGYQGKAPEDDVTVLVLQHSDEEAPTPTFVERLKSWGRGIAGRRS